MRRPRTTWIVILLTILLLTVAQGVVHRLRGDPTGQLQPKTDEPNHFVTALMIRDYVTQAFPRNPIAFAKAYYLHYPKVSFGSWPPLFHLCLGAWMVPFPATRGSALLYEDALTAAFAVAATLIARRIVPLPAAIAVGAASWISPVTQVLGRTVQADTQYALLSLVCTIAFAAYLDKPNHRRAFWFGLALFGSVMTKNNGLFLAISLPLAVLLARSLSILRRWDAWAATLPAVLAFGAWQYLTLPFVWNNMKGVTDESTPGLAFFIYVRQLATLAWIGLLPFAAWAVYRRVFLPLQRRGKAGVLDAALFGLLVGPCLFHSLLPHDVNQRYLLPSLPPLLIFAIEGLLDLLSLPAIARIPQAARLLLAAGIVVLPAAAAPVPRALSFQYDSLAARLIAAYPKETAPAFLISASFDGEALFVGEMAVRERRPGHWLLRASKLLRHRVGVLNRETALIQTSPAEVLERFQDLPVSLVVIADDGDLEQATERSFLEGMIRDHPDLFRLVLTSPVGSGCYDAPCTIRVYQMQGNPQARFSPDKLPQNMQLWKNL
jgi:hypothetical protein